MTRLLRTVGIAVFSGVTLWHTAGCTNMDGLIATSVEDSKRMLSIVVDTMTDQHAAMMPEKKDELAALREVMTQQFAEVHSSVAGLVGDVKNSLLALFGVGGMGGAFAAGKKRGNAGKSG